MEKFVADHGSSAVIPDIRRALDFDLDGTADRTDTDADGDGLPAAEDAIVRVAGGAGRSSVMAVDEGGTLWSWGGGPQIGGITECDAFATGYGCPPLPATALAELGPVRDVVAGSIEFGGGDGALLDDGRVVVWGMGYPAPQLVTGATSMRALRGGGFASRGLVYAIRNDDTLWKIENGAATQRAGITQAQTVGENDGVLWVLHTDGSVQGYDNDSTATYTVDGLPDAVDFACSDLNYNFAYAVDGDGGLWRWSPRAALSGSATATQVNLGGPVVNLSSDAMFAVLADGTVWRLNTDAPFALTDLSDVVRVSGTLAILRDGTVVTFSGDYYSAGDPVPVYIPR